MLSRKTLIEAIALKIPISIYDNYVDEKQLEGDAIVNKVISSEPYKEIWIHRCEVIFIGDTDTKFIRKIGASN